MRHALVGVIAMICACSSSSSTNDDGRLEARLDGTSMEDTPWPSDVLMRDGHYVVNKVPIEGQAPTLDALAATLSELDGAPTYTSVFFPVNAPDAFKTGPIEGRALYIDLDDPNAKPLETSLFYRSSPLGGDAGGGDLVALAPKDIFTAGHAYACAVVDAPLVKPSAAMRDALDGKGPHASLYAPLRPRLGGGTTINAATVFKVGRPVLIAEKMRDVAGALPAPTATIDKTFKQGAALDDLFGVPDTTRPGLGDPKGVVHEAVERVILGAFDAPSFLHASPPKLGRVEMDPLTGAPKIKGTAKIPFMLALPKKPANGWPASGVPVLIFQHGLNASRAQVATVANDYARAGYATIGIDALGHGDRAMHTKDTKHELTGAQGPDGLADGEVFGAAITIFDLDGDASQGIAPFDGRVVRDNFRQAVVDLTVLVRMLREGDLSAQVAASDPTDPQLAGVTLDASKLVYTSESFGSILGSGALALTPNLDAGVLSVGGGGIFLTTLPRSPMFTGIVAPLLRVSFDSSLDLSDLSALPPDAQRSLALLQAAIMPGDPLAFAPLIRERKKNLLMIMARSDELIPNESTELLASAAHATFVALPERSTPPRFSTTLPSATAPWTTSNGGGESSTIALVQLDPALHTVFTGFIGERRYERDMPPITALSTPTPVDCPIELAHDLAIRFASSYREGTPRVAVADAPK